MSKNPAGFFDRRLHDGNLFDSIVCATAELCEACSAEDFLYKLRRFPMDSMGNRLFYSSQNKPVITRKPLNALRVLQVTAEGLDRSGVRGPLLLDGLFQ